MSIQPLSLNPQINYLPQDDLRNALANRIYSFAAASPEDRRALLTVEREKRFDMLLAKGPWICDSSLQLAEIAVEQGKNDPEKGMRTMQRALNQSNCSLESSNAIIKMAKIDLPRAMQAMEEKKKTTIPYDCAKISGFFAVQQAKMDHSTALQTMKGALSLAENDQPQILLHILAIRQAKIDLPGALKTAESIPAPELQATAFASIAVGQNNIDHDKALNIMNRALKNPEIYSKPFVLFHIAKLQKEIDLSGAIETMKQALDIGGVPFRQYNYPFFISLLAKRDIHEALREIEKVNHVGLRKKSYLKIAVWQAEKDVSRTFEILKSVQPIEAEKVDSYTYSKSLLQCASRLAKLDISKAELLADRIESLHFRALALAAVAVEQIKTDLAAGLQTMDRAIQIASDNTLARLAKYISKLS